MNQTTPAPKPSLKPVAGSGFAAPSRGRNLAVFAGVIGLMVIFFVISILKIQAMPPVPTAAQFGAATASYGAVLPPLPLANAAVITRGED